MNDREVAIMTLMATLTNLQVNIEILEVSKEILKANLARNNELKEIEHDRTLQRDTKDAMSAKTRVK